MKKLWEEMKDFPKAFARCLSGPMGVGKSYITWFLVAKAYAHGWPVHYITDAGSLARCKKDGDASKKICQRFLDLNKDILAINELSTMASYESVEYIAGYILNDFLQQEGKKALFIVDEHSALFHKEPPAKSRLPVLASLGCLAAWTSRVKSGLCVVFTGTVHGKFDRTMLRDSDSYLVFVGPLSQGTFEKLFNIAIARFDLTTQEIFKSRRDAVIKMN